MKLLINIPKEFEQHFQADRFNDSLHRLSADAHLLAGLYEQEIALMLSEAFKDAVPVPLHGDLIDRDALFKEFERNGWFDNVDRDIAEDMLLDAPIIILADKSKEEI